MDRPRLVRRRASRSAFFAPGFLDRADLTCPQYPVPTGFPGSWYLEPLWICRASISNPATRDRARVRTTSA
jgi:hypothetical protein